MNPVAITILLLLGWLTFLWSMWRRLGALRQLGSERRFDRLYERTKRTLIYAFGQARMPRYPLAGILHIVIFWGFLVLLLRSIVLWGRGYDETFNLWILGEGPVGTIYAALKDFFVVAVFVASAAAIMNRLVNRKDGASRMTHTLEAYLILVLICTMMVTDAIYDWSEVHIKARKAGGGEVHLSSLEPLGSILATAIPASGLGDGTLAFLHHLGYWGHTSLVLLFLNLLPYTKHFHVVTAIPNVFLSDLDAKGRLKPIENIYDIEKYGINTIGQFSWKSALDFYTCTECGRCSDNCPAWTTGKLLSPKQLTIDLRNHLYRTTEQLIKYEEPASPPDVPLPSHKDGSGNELGLDTPLVPNIIKEEVIWACTTCRACEDACPVFISYVDKVVDMRRHLVLERGDVPGQLGMALHGIETNSNPWNLSAMDRMAWAEGLDVPVMTKNLKVEYLLWIGCAPSYDDRAKKVTRAMVQLLRKADVKFAVLGNEENCDGDLARRAGNEALFQELAKRNIETLNSYGVKRIVTICPHCYNTLRNEYPDFGGNYLVLTHVELLLDLLRKERLKTHKPAPGERKKKIVYHDSCYLGRYNDIYDEPRELLRHIPAVELIECKRSRNKALCCGAGGGQAFKEEERAREGAEKLQSRVNYRRTQQLIATGADSIVTACPFCMLMITDGLKAKDLEEKIGQKDIAEILLEYC